MIFGHSKGLQVGIDFLFWSCRKSYEDAVCTWDLYLLSYIKKSNVHSIMWKSGSVEAVVN